MVELLLKLSILFILVGFIHVVIYTLIWFLMNSFFYSNLKYFILDLPYLNQ